jgi:tetratricopeptide (TPR) repeat protein
MAGIRNGTVSLVIIDDSLQLPAIRTLRSMLTDPVGNLTPILALMMENSKNEHAAIKQLGRPEIIEKPLTPSKFVPAFVNLVKVWEREPFVQLRHAAVEFLDSNGAAAIKILSVLLENRDIYPFATQALALKYRLVGRLKEAESLLLTSLRRNPRNIGLIFSLVDLYNSAAMPHLAKKFLQVARNSYLSSTCMIPDMVQTAIFMGHLDEAIRHLMSLHQGSHLDERSLTFLARLLFAEGREAEAERVLGANRTLFKKLSLAWSSAESVQSIQPRQAS